jgi:hypothetical protein
MMFLATRCWNASVRPSAVQDGTCPLFLALLVIGAPRGHLHTRCDPVATPKAWIAGPPAEASRLATASLVPSGESAMSDVIKVDGVPVSTSTATGGFNIADDGIGHDQITNLREDTNTG